MALSYGQIVWFTGLSGAGKTTLCRSLAIELQARNIKVEILDADEIRRTLCADLGYGLEDRQRNISRIAFVAEVLSRHGITVLVAAICPLQSMRDMLRNKLPNFIEVFVDAPLEVCESRDPKGLYKKARNGEVPNLTGIDSPFEIPSSPDVVCRTDREDIVQSTDQVLKTVLGQRERQQA